MGRTVLRWRGGLLAALTLVSSGLAQEASWRVIADPGDVSRGHSPVSVWLEVGRDIPEERRFGDPERWLASVRPVLSGGTPRVAQLDWGRRRDERGRLVALGVHWIEPELTAGEPVELELDLMPVSEMKPEHFDLLRSPRFRYADRDEHRELLLGDRPLWRHETVFDPERFEATYKTYHHLYGFDGRKLITKGPGGKYPHHRGLFIGWSKTIAAGEEHNFWFAGEGRSESQQHRGSAPEREALGHVMARSISTSEWVSGERGVIVRDRRTLTTWAQPEGLRLMDFEIKLASASGEVLLDGDPAHAGIQFRAAQEVAEAESCTYLRPASAEGGENDNWSECPWVVGRFPVGGQAYAVMHMDHPDNPRPTVYNTRSYGRFGAFFTATLREGEPLVLRYRILVLDGEKHAGLAAEDCQGLYRAFVEPVRTELTRE